jgi:hypothetical protein
MFIRSESVGRWRQKLIENLVRASVARDAAGNFETIAVGQPPSFHGKVNGEREADHNQREEGKSDHDSDLRTSTGGSGARSVES